MTRVLTTLVLAGFLLISTACTSDNPADLVLTNGQIVTMDDEEPEAEALAAKDGEILAVGTAEEIEEYIGSGTEVIDLEGQMAIPGFIEGHAHFTGIGNAQMQLQLLGVRSWEAIVDMVAEAAEEAEPGELILGRGWHQDDWDTTPEPNVGGLPHHDELSAVSPDNPVVLTHASGHMTFANEHAMEMAGVTAETEDPEGGEIVRDAQGNPIGAFRQRASGLLSSVTQRWDPDIEEQVEMATREALSKGVTTVHDAGSPIRTIEVLREIDDRGDLRIRLWVMARDNNERLAEGLPQHAHANEDSPYLTVGGLKKAIDGALGTHGAWLLEPYEDQPNSTGFNTTPLEEIEEAGRLAVEHDLQLAVHAIGDRGNRETLDLFERVWDETGVDGSDLRWRVEHAQTLHPDDVPRFVDHGVIASMQGVHCTSDGPWVPDRLGEERARERAYVWRSLLDSGAVIVNGTDAPVEDIDPIASYYASVTRDTGEDGAFFPEQSMTREEALRSYTRDAAYAAFQEDSRGTLTPGKLADVTVLSQNLLTVPEDQLLDTEVVYTIVGGAVRYARDGRE